MRPNSGKKGSRGTKGSKKDQKVEAKRGGKPARGGKKGAKHRPGSRPERASPADAKNKLSGRRRGDLSGKDLRFLPVVFVKAVEDFELTLETKPGEEANSELRPAPIAAPIADIPTDPIQLSQEPPEEASGVPTFGAPSDVEKEAEPNLDATLGSAPETAEPAAQVPDIETADQEQLQTQKQEKGKLYDLETLAQPAPADDAALEDDAASEDELDKRLQAQFAAQFADTTDAFDGPTLTFDESVSRLALSSSSDSDYGSPFEYDQYTASQVDESIFESLSDEEPPSQFRSLTYDDFDFSDMRAQPSQDEQDASDDENDNMNELDDDQIFALASMATRRVSEYDELDTSGFDKYDEFDEYFDQLLDRSTDAPPSTKARASEARRLRREARELMHSMNFGKDPVLWDKYPDEIGVREVLEEIRHFAAQSEFQSLSFPPLDSNANWYVKELAREHGLNHSVEGRNTTKHVICYLTGRATPNGGKGVNKLLNRRKFFRRVDRPKFDGKPGRSGKDGKERAPGAKVRDGHVVGQHASEITNENFGHRLMRQMGWSEGSGLGKERAGIVAPISATVKLTKTGLGAN